VYFLCFWDVWSVKILFLRCSDRYFPFFFLVFSVFCTRYFEVLRYLKRLFGESHHHFWPLVLIRLRLRVSSGNRSGTPWVLDYQLALENQETGRNPMLTNQLMRLWASHRVWEHKLQRLAPSAPGSRSRCPGFFLGIRYVPRCTKTPPHPTPPPGPRPPDRTTYPEIPFFSDAPAARISSLSSGTQHTLFGNNVMFRRIKKEIHTRIILNS